MEKLETIQGYVTPGHDDYDASYSFVVVKTPDGTIADVNVTWKYDMRDSKRGTRRVTVIDYNTTSESSGNFPPYLESLGSFGLAIVEVNKNSKGFAYYLKKGFIPYPFKYYHMSESKSAHELKEVILMIQCPQGFNKLNMQEVVEGYAKGLDKSGKNDSVQFHKAANLKALKANTLRTE